MQRELLKATDKIMQYKKHIVLAGFALAMVFLIGIGLIGAALYQSTIFVKDQASVGKNVVLDVASAWISESLTAAETQKVIAGLSCLDALGGPKPQHVIDYVKTRVEDPMIRARLDEFGPDFEKRQTAGVETCASWILGS